MSKNTDLYLTKYEQLLFSSDFNAGAEDSSVKTFCFSYNLTNMSNRPTRFKKPERPSCIDLILTNYSRSFRNSYTIETGLSDFYKLVVKVMRTTYKKSQSKIIIYCSYKYFNSEIKSHNRKQLSIAVTNISIVNVLEKNYYKFKAKEITAMKILKILLLHVMLS